MEPLRLLILNGPNLNLLGQREPGVYGSESFGAYLEKLRCAFQGIRLDHHQSNVEGELVNALQDAAHSYDGVIFNAGGYTHTSVALRDAVAAIHVPVIEVHISNILSREEFRHTSLLTGVCVGMVSGFGLDSYRLAVEAFRMKLGQDR
ncbi:MAG: type II 3-dehydroquinate dehydratase [Flavobacteriales bacterium]|nr:type II 3-dehydroquinate dehydratase [Flavobacteriales bacterium]